MVAQWLAPAFAVVALFSAGRAQALALSDSLSDTPSFAQAWPGPAAVVETVQERVYAGLPASTDQKLVLPAARNARGQAECVQLLKALMAAPMTAQWREGRLLKASWTTVQPGTAIATFKQGRYPNHLKGRGRKHAAIFLRATDSGIYVLDQYAGLKVASERFIPWHNARDGKPANSAASYSTVVW